MKRIAVGVVTVLMVAGLAAPAGADDPAPGTVTTFKSPGNIGAPYAITLGADGNLWFTNGKHALGQITPAGVVTKFKGNGIDSSDAITTAAGEVWYLGVKSSISHITPEGTVTKYQDRIHVQSPADITPGSDGSVWFTNAGSNSIGRITTAGVATKYSGAGVGLGAITLGSDGALWFPSSHEGLPAIGRVTTSGRYSWFSDPDFDGATDITAGPDGALWFTDFNGSQVGKITAAGAFTMFPDVAIDHPQAIAGGPDGNVWFVNGAHAIARVTPAGVVTSFHTAKIRTAGGITAGPDGAMWFTNGKSIGRIQT